jgi:phage head maturation protease
VVPNTALGDEMHALLKMGAIRGLSIGYRVDEADYNSDGVRLLKQWTCGKSPS